MVEEHAQKADQVALLDADNQLSSLSTNLETQTLSRHGKDALAAGPEVQDAWTKGASDISNGLTNDRQREAFAARADHHWNLLNETVQKHGAQEFQKYDADNTTAAIQNRLTDSVNNYTDPARLNQNVAESKDLVTLYGQRNGESPDVIQEKATRASSSIHTGVIDRMLTDGNDITAQTYFDAHKGEMTSEDILRVEKPLEIGSTLGKAQRNRNTILSTTTNQADAIAAARQIQNPREQEETERLLRQGFAEDAAMQRDQREKIMTGAAGIIESTHSFDAIPPSTIATMTVQERSALREYADKLAGGSFIKTDLPTYDRLETMSSVPETRDKFLQLDLNTYKSKLDPADFKHFSELQASVRKGEDKPVFGEESKHALVTDVMKQAGIGINKKGKVLDATVVGGFRLAVDKQVNLLHEQTGKLPGPDDITRIANELAAKHVVSRPQFFGLWDSNENVRTFQLNPGEVPQIQSIKDVPSDAKRQITNALRNRRLPVTEAAIVNEYKNHVQTLLPEP